MNVIIPLAAPVLAYAFVVWRRKRNDAKFRRRAQRHAAARQARQREIERVTLEALQER